MTEAIPVAVFWSGGKDSALALWRLMNDKRYRVVKLVTTVNRDLRRVSMHGVPENLLEEQTALTGFPLLKMEFTGGTNAAYEETLRDVFETLRTEGIRHIAYGDIFLEDLKTYRDNLLNQSGMKGVYPLWKNETRELLDEFFNAGFRTIICCADAQKLGEAWAGRELNREAIDQLPVAIDPCGENGEFHTFCFEGPIFRTSVSFHAAPAVYRPVAAKAGLEQGFWYADLQPVTS